jgi:hypothetical protein
VHRNSAKMRPPGASVTTASQTCVVAAQVLGARLADEGALADRSEMVAFQLDGREGSGALGQVGERGVGAGYV